MEKGVTKYFIQRIEAWMEEEKRKDPLFADQVLGKRLAYAVVLCYDLLLLMTRPYGIAMLPGWRASRGASNDYELNELS